MACRTDLALESVGNLDFIHLNGVSQEIRKAFELTVTEIKVESEEAAGILGKPVGAYVTIEFPSLSRSCVNLEDKIKVVSKEIQKLISADGLVFVVGLGNSVITPDALGPKVVESVLATRHIEKETRVSAALPYLRPVAVLSPGVLGQTGIEVSEIISSVCDHIKPRAVLVIDALAAKELHRLGSTIQLSDTGILPGSGVGNKRVAINSETIGVPVVSIGSPTVVDGLTLIESIVDLEEMKELASSFKNQLNKDAKTMIVTPREIDVLIEKSAEIISMAINLALQPDYSLEDLNFLVS